MTDLINQITADLQRQIDAFKPSAEVSDVGTVIDAGDGIARVRGLDGVRSQELVQFANGVMGICLLYTSDAADDLLCVDLGGRRIITKKTHTHIPITSLHN